MIRIITVILIGRMFSNLAKKHNKNYWVAGLLSGLATLILQLLLEFLIAIFFLDSVLSNNGFGFALAISLVGMVIGTVVMYGIFVLFKKSWEKTPIDNSSLLDR